MNQQQPLPQPLIDLNRLHQYVQTCSTEIDRLMTMITQSQTDTRPLSDQVNLLIRQRADLIFSIQTEQQHIRQQVQQRLQEQRQTPMVFFRANSRSGLGLGSGSGLGSDIPTPAQLRNGSRVRKFDTIEDPRNTTCPIDMDTFQPDDFVVELNHCHHLFTPWTFYQHYARRSQCPVCRHDIRQQNVPTTTNTTLSESDDDDDDDENDTHDPMVDEVDPVPTPDTAPHSSSSTSPSSDRVQMLNGEGPLRDILGQLAQHLLHQVGGQSGDEFHISFETID